MEYHDDIKNPTIFVKIIDGKVIMNGKVVLEDKKYEHATDIIGFILDKENMPFPQMAELYHKLNDLSKPSEELYSELEEDEKGIKAPLEERKKLKEKLSRMSKEIEKHI